MSQRADRELDRLLHIGRPEASPSFADDVMSRIAITDEPMPIAPAIVWPMRGRSRSWPPGQPGMPQSLYLRTAIVTAPLVAMLALVFVLATTLFADKGSERRGPDDSSGVINAGGPLSDDNLAASDRRDALERKQTALNAAEPHDLDGKRRCSTCHEMAKLVSFGIPAIAAVPAIDLSGSAPAPLGMVAYVDMDAPDASEMMLAIETMVLKFSRDVSIEIRNPNAASHAARAALVAAQRGGYWQMIECLGDRGHTDDAIRACASAARVDAGELEREMLGATVTAALHADVEVANRAGIRGPAIVIGDRVFAGPHAHVDARDFVNVALARRTASL
jgi:hypothetical protein